MTPTPAADADTQLDLIPPPDDGSAPPRTRGQTRCLADLSAGAEGARGAAAPVAPAGVLRPRVLDVEDYDAAAESLCELLDLWGFDPRLIGAGREARAASISFRGQGSFQGLVFEGGRHLTQVQTDLKAG